MEEGFKGVKTLTNKSVLSGLLSLQSRWYLRISDAGARDAQFRQTVHYGAGTGPAAQRRVAVTLLLQLLPAGACYTPIALVKVNSSWEVLIVYYLPRRSYLKWSKAKIFFFWLFFFL